MEEELEARVARLEELVGRLARENERLRAERPHERQIPRRRLLKGAALAAAGAGVAVLGAAPAEATTGTMQYGTTNDAGGDGTAIQSSSAGTLACYNSGAATGDGVTPVGLFGQSQNGSGVYGASGSVGAGVYGEVFNATNQAAVFGAVRKGVNVPALKGTVEGAGSAVDATSTKGIGVWGHLGAKNPSDAVRGITSGSGSGVAGVSYSKGPGVSGSSDGGRGGVFAGGAAPIQLKPSSRATHPSAGKRGDLFVDASGRLWFCTTGGSPATWKQLA